MSFGQSSAVFIHHQALSSASNHATEVSSVTVHPVALFSILDHYLRRKDEQARVIGTLLGAVSDSGEVEVRSSFAVPHSENEQQVAIDGDHHRTMYELHHRVNPKEVVVGWYSTGSNLNANSALIQNLYSQETTPLQAVHLAIDTGLEESGKGAGVKAYISSLVGISPKPENCVFVPVPVELRFRETEKSGLDLLASASSAAAVPGVTRPISDLEALEQSIKSVTAMLDRVLSYVRSVLAGEVQGDPAVGKYLLDTFAASTDNLEKGGFNANLQDTLMVSYLANLVRSQAEISSRLALAASS